MVLYCRQITPRIAYIASWLGNYLFASPLNIVTNPLTVPEGSYTLNYSDQLLSIPNYQVLPHGLLEQAEIRDQKIIASEIDGLPVFFINNGQHSFDLLAAIFYFITRYEEYLPHEKDMYGRYAHINSIAFKQGFLNRPLVDEWMLDLKQKLQQSFPEIQFAERSFNYLPTFDVDIAWSYLHKGLLINTAGLLKNLVQRQWTFLGERLQTMFGLKPDPFAVFPDLAVLHKQYNLQPVFFFLLAEKRIGYDKNIAPKNTAFQSLIRQLSIRYKTGIHLSWQASQQPSVMQLEKQLLESICGKQITANRMHYINFHLPQTFEQLEALDIYQEYSMGYGSINGFRASTCTPYQWYNLAKEAETILTIFPYAYMEANSIFEQKDDQETALKELQHYHDIVLKAKGTLITIFHNHLIGRSAEGRKCWQVYERFVANNFKQQQ